MRTLHDILLSNDCLAWEKAREGFSSDPEPSFEEYEFLAESFALSHSSPLEIKNHIKNAINSASLYTQNHVLYYLLKKDLNEKEFVYILDALTYIENSYLLSITEKALRHPCQKVHLALKRQLTRDKNEFFATNFCSEIGPDILKTPQGTHILLSVINHHFRFAKDVILALFDKGNSDVEFFPRTVVFSTLSEDGKKKIMDSLHNNFRCSFEGEFRILESARSNLHDEDFPYFKEEFLKYKVLSQKNNLSQEIKIAEEKFLTPLRPNSMKKM